MNYHRIKQKVLVPLLVIPVLFSAGSALAQDTAVDTSLLTDVTESAARSFAAGAETQVRINQLSDQADEAISQYGSASKRVDGLEIYNATFRRTIAQQVEQIATYNESIDSIAGLQRQIAPLMERMMVALEQFVALDLPFDVAARQERLQRVRASFDDPNVNVAARFSALLSAYTIESDYGRGMDAYTEKLEIGGVERDVDILRVGRVALLYQTNDRTSTGVWDKAAGTWVTVGDEYRRPVSEAIRLARQLTSQHVLELPISVPE